MKTKVISSVIMLILAIAVFTTATIAWFTPSAQYIENIVISSGTIEISAQLFIMEDFDLDGTPDIVNGEKIYTPINAINISGMKPGDVYSYRLNMKNIGDTNGNLKIKFSGIDEALKEVLSFSSTVYDEQDNEITNAGTSGKKLFSGNLDFAEVADIAFVEATAEPQIKVFFNITFETLEQLKILNPMVFDTVENLNDYQNLNFSIAKILVNLSQSV